MNMRFGLFSDKVSPDMGRIVFIFVSLFCFAWLFYVLGHSAAVNEMLAPRSTDSIIDGTCREILGDEMRVENETA